MLAEDRTKGIIQYDDFLGIIRDDVFLKGYQGHHVNDFGINVSL